MNYVGYNYNILVRDHEYEATLALLERQRRLRAEALCAAKGAVLPEAGDSHVDVGDLPEVDADRFKHLTRRS